jgi:stearoyl-CoA desaturase (delta-9 desaturase)
MNSNVHHDEVITDPAVLHSILATLPSTESIKPDWKPALYSLGFTLSLLLTSLFFLSARSYIIFAFALFFTCFALSLLYLIAQDCVNNIFTPSATFNRLIGQLVLLPFFASYTAFPSHLSSSEKQSNEERNKRNRLYKDDGTYDDALPIWHAMASYLRTHQDLHSIVVHFILLSISSVLLYFSPMFFLKSWLLPFILYPFVFPTVMTIFSNSLDTRLSSPLISTIPSYHLSLVSTLINDHQTGKQRKVIHNNTPARQASGVIDEWRQFIVDTWPRLHWVNIVFVCVSPIIGFIGARYVPLTTPTMIWAVTFYIISGLGITAGYHRLFAHRAYEAQPSVVALMIFMGTAALQGTVKWWCGGHRIHHRYTDTDLDPYSAKAGFFFAHIGWMLVHPKPENKVKADLKDLNDNAMIRWQHKNYLWFGPFCAFVFPTLVAGLGWGDWSGGLIYAGIIRLFVVHQATFCVNSVAHFLGEHTFDDNRTPRDHIVTAFLTFGEGYHNFHHEFPNDYRNGIRMFDYDPTKWLIKALNLLGLTYQLRVFPSNEIEKGKAHMKEKNLKKLKSTITYPPSVDTLPSMTWEDIKVAVKSGRQLTVIDDIVHDITPFIGRHPGGRAFIESSVGCDATVRFRGETGVYKHSQAAWHLLSGYRIARLEEDEEEKRERKAREQERVKKYNKIPLW